MRIHLHRNKRLSRKWPRKICSLVCGVAALNRNPKVGCESTGDFRGRGTSGNANFTGGGVGRRGKPNPYDDMSVADPNANSAENPPLAVYTDQF